MITLFDLFILIFLGVFTLFGFWFGFFHALGALFGALLGTIIATRTYEPFADIATSIFGMPNVMKVIVFLIIFFVINRLVGFGFMLLEKSTKLLTKLPFIRSIDRLAGGVIGFVEGVLVIGLLLFFVSRFPLNAWFVEQMQASVVTPWFVESANILKPLIPEALKNLGSVIGVI